MTAPSNAKHNFTYKDTSITAKWQRGFRSPLARKLTLATVLVSSVLALLMTVFNLYVEYQRDLTALDSSVESLSETLVPGLAESLWILDDTLIERQLDGIVHIQGVEFARLIDEDGTSFSAGTEHAQVDRTYEIPLIRYHNGPAQTLGSLHVSVSYEGLVSKALRRAVDVFGTNILKTFIVSAFLMLIYQLLIGQHLNYLAVAAAQYDPNQALEPILLSRDVKVKDELTTLQDAMNNWMEVNYLNIHNLRKANSEILDAKANLESKNRQLIDANKEQAEFTYSLSHDLKSPTNTMLMLIDFLRESENLDEPSKEILLNMQKTNFRMSRLIEDILIYSRTVKGDFVSESVEISKVIDEVLEDLASDISAAGAEVQVSELPQLHGSKTQLRMLFQNLIGNALKFRSEDRSVKIEVSAFSNTEGELVFRVADNGIGIEKKFRGHVFGLFKRFHDPIAFEGSGLGLAICKRVATNHNAEISVVDGIDGGTAFHVVFADPV